MYTTSLGIATSLSMLGRPSLTSSDDFLFADVVGMDFGCKLQYSCVGVLVGVRVHVGLQGL